MPFYVLNDNGRTKCIAKIILVIERHPRIIVGKDGNAFRKMRSHFPQVNGRAEPMPVGFLSIGVISQPSETFEKPSDKDRTANTTRPSSCRVVP